MRAGPCAKRRVRCTIVAPDGRAVTGENWCENSQPTCPRKPGEGYDKCHAICMQVGHAEEVALDMARAEGFRLEGAIAVIAGHEHVCGGCQGALKSAGIDNWTLGDAWI